LGIRDVRLGEKYQFKLFDMCPISFADYTLESLGSWNAETQWQHFE
jgi:hypothetical protein